jgi:hypothetical protein
MEVLAKKIKQKPTPISKVEVGNQKKSVIIQADDSVYREDKSHKGWVSWCIGIFLLAGWFFLIYGNIEDNFWYSRNTNFYIRFHCT